ncbi:hypothetical protein C8Q78DRAFT_1078138 [Trametes maxima]|nr:hypothetical protein C8Q78DRAFT_1078138 [Trametes maxima]
MSNVVNAVDSGEPTLSEAYVQECFHSYLKSSLAHAKVEGLLDTDTLSSAEADLMITGPALCLYFAALRSTTNPPSVPLPRRSKTSGTALAPADLSLTNCPPAFRPFLLVWSQLVPQIQALAPEHQHDLARVICGLAPRATPLNPRLNGIAADMRAVAIEISMRRTFQEKYADDLQAALDTGTGGAGRSDRRLKASFMPPPSYDDNNAAGPPPTSPPASARSLEPPSSPSSSSRHTHSRASSRTSVSSPPISPSPLPPSAHAIGPPTPTILAEETPGLEFIRETLYAALAEILARKPQLRALLLRPAAAPRAYFAAVAFAILDVAASSATRPDPTLKTLADILPSPAVADEPVIRGVLGQTLALHDCPAALRPFMAELCAIGAAAHAMEEEDSEAAVRALQRGEEPPVPRLERAREIIEGGVGHVYNDTVQGGVVGGVGAGAGGDLRRRRTSTEGRAVAFANRVNGLALAMTKLRAFRERQDMVFKVLAGVEG